MPSRPARSALRAAIIACLAGGALAGTAAGVQAEDGLGGFLQRLFAPAPAVPAWSPESAGPSGFGEKAVSRRGIRGRHARYASLPRAPLALHVGQRQTPLDIKDGVTAAFLKDETLRPGDIVILPEGAAVFTGGRGERHHRSDFALASGSARLDRKTRTLLAAMARPRGPAPAGRVLTRASAASPSGVTEPQAQASLVRVVSPWRTAP